MGIRIGVAQIIDRDNLDFIRMYALIQRAQNIPADTSIAVDTYFNGHCLCTPRDSTFNVPSRFSPKAIPLSRYTSMPTSGANAAR
jgi:hypothetical protein